MAIDPHEYWGGANRPFRSRFSPRLRPELERDFIEWALPEVSRSARGIIFACVVMLCAGALIFHLGIFEVDQPGWMVFVGQITIFGFYYFATYFNGPRRYWVTVTQPGFALLLSIVYFEYLVASLPPHVHAASFGAILVAAIALMVFERLFFLNGAMSAAMAIGTYLFYYDAWQFSYPSIGQIGFQITMVAGVGIGTMFVLHRRDRLIYLMAVEQERQRDEHRQVLDQMLPRQWTEELANDITKRPAEQYASVSVVFADVVGFTAAVHNWPASEIVRFLDQLFHRIDDEARIHGVEKVKTIGDGYMAVAGCPEPVQHHAQQACIFAANVVEIVAEFGRRFEVPIQARVGVHTGPVVAGIVGKSRLSFDIWGETVNVASRLESMAPAGRVLLSQETAGLLPETFALAEQQSVSVKGIGEMQVHELRAAPADI